MRLESEQSSNYKSRWRIVRTDDFKDLIGEIIAADDITGECSMKFRGETKTQCFGPGGIKIVGRRR